ncbi:MAG: VOC family protein [Dehalococcoidia bacterium]
MSMPQIPALMPMFSVSDVAATIAWFERLGFTSEGEMRMPDGSIMHAEVTRGPLRFMFGPAQGEVGAPGLGLYVTLNESVDEYHTQAVRAGVPIAEPLQDQFWGDRTFTVKHPDGYQITFCQHVRDVSMEEMQAALAQMVPAGA